MCLAKCLCSYKDDLLGVLDKGNAQVFKKSISGYD